MKPTLTETITNINEEIEVAGTDEELLTIELQMICPFIVRLLQLTIGIGTTLTNSKFILTGRAAPAYEQHVKVKQQISSEFDAYDTSGHC